MNMDLVLRTSTSGSHSTTWYGVSPANTSACRSSSDEDGEVDAVLHRQLVADQALDQAAHQLEVGRPEPGLGVDFAVQPEPQRVQMLHRHQSVNPVQEGAIVGGRRLVEQASRRKHDLVPHRVQRRAVFDVADHVGPGKELLAERLVAFLERLGQRHRLPLSPFSPARARPRRRAPARSPR
jgi:hypothetical protein